VQQEGDIEGAQKRSSKQDEGVAELISDVPDGPPDFWEGEQWNVRHALHLHPGL
jgi:hypothetical protein